MTLAIITTSCYTAYKCPAYSYNAEKECEQTVVID